MFKKINYFLSCSLAVLLFFAVVLPEVGVAESEGLNVEISNNLI